MKQLLLFLKNQYNKRIVDYNFERKTSILSRINFLGSLPFDPNYRSQACIISAGGIIPFDEIISVR